MIVLFCFKYICFLTDPDEEWTAHKVELALWTEVMAKKLNFDLSQECDSVDNGSGTRRSKRKASTSSPQLKKRMKK